MSQKLEPTPQQWENARFAVMFQVEQHKLNMDDPSIKSFVELCIANSAQSDATISHLYSIINENLVDK